MFHQLNELLDQSPTPEEMSHKLSDKWDGRLHFFFHNLSSPLHPISGLWWNVFADYCVSFWPLWQIDEEIDL